MDWNALGGIVASALFVMLIFVAALVDRNALATCLAVGSVGAAFCTYQSIEFRWPWLAAVAFYLVSLGLAALAFAALLAGYYLASLTVAPGL